jgi:hypothetical protein
VGCGEPDAFLFIAAVAHGRSLVRIGFGGLYTNSRHKGSPNTGVRSHV